MSHDDLPFAPACLYQPTRLFIIAEIGVNHDGKLGRGIDLVAAARRAGADAVKLQLFDPDRLLSAQAQLASYQAQAATDPVEMLRALALSLEDMHALRNAARDAGLHFIVTPFSLPDVYELASLDVDMVKIASPDAVNTPLLHAVASLGKPMIISTGTCQIDELTPAAGLLAAHTPGGAFLQCVSSYPTPEPDTALGGIRALIARFGLPVGYSDHTAALDTGALAVAASACLLEKHLTYDPAAPGPDHAASLSPDDFTRYVALARRAAVMLGPIAKHRLPVEDDVAKVSRQSLAAAHDLPAGHVIEAGDVTPKRPGTGIPAATDLLGRTLAKSVKANHLLEWDDLAAEG